MKVTSKHSRHWASGMTVLAALVPQLLWAATTPSSNPIAVCTDSSTVAQQSRTYYRFKFSDTSSSGTLVRLDLPDGTQAGATGTTPTPVETTVLTTPYQTAGMGTAADGTIYGMESCGSVPRAGCNNLNLLRYDASGATVVGPVTGLPGITGPGSQLGAGVNAADIDLTTGDLIVGILRSGGSMSTLYRINVNTLVATPITLSPAIPGASSGDLVVDPTGQFAYGVSLSTSLPFLSYVWKANLSTGAVTTLQTVNGAPFPIGGAAWLANGKIALTSNKNTPGGTGSPTAGITFIGDSSSGAMLTNDYGANPATTMSDSTDGSACMPRTRVTKRVQDTTGAPVAAAPAGNYVLTATCTGGAPSFTALSGLAGTVTNVNSVSAGVGYADVLLPVGSTGCTVTENTASLPTAPAGYSWGATPTPTYVQPASPIPLVTPSASITNVLTLLSVTPGGGAAAVPTLGSYVLGLLGLLVAGLGWRHRRNMAV